MIKRIYTSTIYERKAGGIRHIIKVLKRENWKELIDLSEMIVNKRKDRCIWYAIDSEKFLNDYDIHPKPDLPPDTSGI